MQRDFYHSSLSTNVTDNCPMDIIGDPIPPLSVPKCVNPLLKTKVLADGRDSTLVVDAHDDLRTFGPFAGRFEARR